MIKLKNIGSLNVDKVTRVKQRQKRKSQISERQETELRIKAMMEQRKANNNSKVQNRNIYSFHPNLLSSSSQSSKNSKHVPPESLINVNKFNKNQLDSKFEAASELTPSHPHYQAKHFKLEQKALNSQISKVRQPSQVSSLSSSKDNFEMSRKSNPEKKIHGQLGRSKLVMSSRLLHLNNAAKLLQSHDLISQPSERLQKIGRTMQLTRQESKQLINQGVMFNKLQPSNPNKPKLIRKQSGNLKNSNYYKQQNEKKERSDAKVTVINVPKEAMKCNSHGRELRRIDSKFKSQVSITSDLSVGPSVRAELSKIHSPSRFFDRQYKNQTDLKIIKTDFSKAFIVGDSQAKEEGGFLKVGESQQIKTFNLQKDSKADVAESILPRPRCQNIKLQEKLKPLNNSMVAKDSPNATISSIENSQEFNVESHRDEEISESEDEKNLNPHQQIASLKPNKVMLDQKMQAHRQGSKKVNQFKDPSLDARHKNKVSMLSGQSRLSTARLETQQIDQTSRYPSKSEQVSQFQVSNLKNQSADMGFGKTQMKDYFNMKTETVPKTDMFHHNRLCLRLQNLYQLHPKVFAGKHNLLHLDLRNNRLKKLPDQICELILLREMLLDYNFLKDLPYGLDRLKHLKLLSLSQNLLKRLPSSLFFPQSQLEHLHLNDNKLTQIPEEISNLKQLQTLFMQNNQVSLVPISFYKCENLKHFGLDWFVYLTADHKEPFSDEFCLSSPTKVIRIDEVAIQSPTREAQIEFKETQEQHVKIMSYFMKMCKLARVHLTHRLVQEVRQRNMLNPQQDDYETERVQEVPQRVSDKGIKHLTFLMFLMFFLGIPHLEQLVLNKQYHGNKHRKLSHLLAMNGHEQLFKTVVANITQYQDASFVRKNLNSTATNIRHLFINAVDQDFSTPLILALKNKKFAMINVLLKTRQVCYRQSSMKYGTPLHVALQNEDFKNALKIIKILKANKKQLSQHDINRHDEDGNTPLHLVMRNFQMDISKSIKIARELIKLGARLDLTNKLLFSPLNYACFFGQTEAVRFAIGFNLKQKRKPGKHVSFDLSDRGGKLEFTPLHHAVFQNNFVLITMLLNQNVDLRKRDVEGRTPLNLCNSISSVFKTIRRQHQLDRLKKIQELEMQRVKLPDQEIVHQNLSSKFRQPQNSSLFQESRLQGEFKAMVVHSTTAAAQSIQSIRQAHSLNTTRVHSPDRFNPNKLAQHRQLSRKDRSQEQAREASNVTEDRSGLKGIRSINEIIVFAEAFVQSEGEFDNNVVQTDNSLFKSKKQMIHCMQIPDKFKKNLSLKGTLATKLKPEFVWQSKAMQYRKSGPEKKAAGQSKDHTLRIISKVAQLSSDEELEILNQQTENDIEMNAVENVSIESKSIMRSQISQIHNQYKEWIDYQETIKSVKSSSLKVSEEIDRNSESVVTDGISSEGGEEGQIRSLSPLSSLCSNTSELSIRIPSLVRQLNSKFNILQCSNSELVSHLCQFYDLEVLTSVKDLQLIEQIVLSFDKNGGTPLITAEAVHQLLNKGGKLMKSDQMRIEELCLENDSNNSNCNFSISDGEGAAEQYNHQMLMNSTLENVKQNANRCRPIQPPAIDSCVMPDISSEHDPNVFTIKEEDFKRSHSDIDLKQIFEYQQKVRQETQAKLNSFRSGLDQSAQAERIAKGMIEIGFNQTMKKKKLRFGNSESIEFLSNQSQIEDETTFQNHAMSHIHTGQPMMQNKKHLFLELDSIEVPPVQMVLTILQKYSSSRSSQLAQDLSPIDRQHLSLYLQRVQMNLYNPSDQVRTQLSRIEDVAAEAVKLIQVNSFFKWFSLEAQQTLSQFKSIQVCMSKRERPQKSISKKDLPMQYKPNLLKTIKPQSGLSVTADGTIKISPPRQRRETDPKLAHPPKKPMSKAIPPRQGRHQQ